VDRVAVALAIRLHVGRVGGQWGPCAGLLVGQVVVDLVILLAEPESHLSDDGFDDEEGGVRTGAVRKGG